MIRGLAALLNGNGNGGGQGGGGGSTHIVEEGVFVGSFATSTDSVYAARKVQVTDHETMSGIPVTTIKHYSPNTNLNGNSFMAQYWCDRLAQYRTERPGIKYEITFAAILDDRGANGAKYWPVANYAGATYVAGDRIVAQATGELYQVPAGGGFTATSGQSFSTVAASLTDLGPARNFANTTAGGYFGGDLRNAAEGDLDFRFEGGFTRLAPALAADDVFVPTHEAYGSGWYPWQIGGNYNLGNPDATASDGGASIYLAAHRRLKQIAVAHGITIPWVLNVNPDTGTGKNNVYNAYDPAVYDGGISLDLYDQANAYNTNAYRTGTSAYRLGVQQSVWTNTTLPALERAAAFARAHQTTLRFSEWGVWTRSDDTGGGENAYFISQMLAWMKANRKVVVKSLYFDFTGGDANHRLRYDTASSSPTIYPLSAAAYKAGVADPVFGTATVSTPTSGTVSPLVKSGA